MAESLRIFVRPANSSQVEGLAELRQQFWADQQTKGLLDATPDCSPAATLKLIGRPRTHVLVAEDGSGDLKGFLFGQTKLVPGPTPARVSSVEEVYVSADARGQRIAASLTEAAVRAFREDGADRIQLRVLHANDGAFAFWGRVGFEPYLTVFELLAQDAAK